LRVNLKNNKLINKYTIEKRDEVLLVTFIQNDFSKAEFCEYLDDLEQQISLMVYAPIIFDLRKSKFLSSENREIQVTWSKTNKDLLIQKIHSFCYIITNVMIQMIVNNIQNKINLTIPSYSVKNMAQAVHKTTVAS